MATSTPLLLFAYKRPDHFRQVLEALPLDEIETIFLFCDGPKNEEDRAATEEVAALAHGLSHPDLRLRISESNKGLRSSITSGIAEALREFDRFVILEDDCVPLPGFWNFMCTALEKYADAPEVSCVSAFTHPVPELSNLADGHAFFWPRFWSWGWAGWKDKWEAIFTVETAPALERLEKAGTPLKSFGSDIPDTITALNAGKLDSWAVPWFLNTVSHGLVSIYPVRSLVKNIGLDGTGRHCKPAKRFQLLPPTDSWPPEEFSFPAKIKVDPAIDQHILTLLERRD